MSQISRLSHWALQTSKIASRINIGCASLMFSSDIVHQEDSGEICIPKYEINREETIEKRKSRLLYQSRKRGMLENDLLLSTFAAKYLKDMNEEQTVMYDKLINLPSNDWDIYYWAIGVKPTPAEYDNEIMNLFKKHVKNDNRDVRLRQPNLN